MVPVEIVITGTLPLLLHSQEGMNRANPDARELSILNKKRSKQDDDYQRIADLEMRLGVYWDRKRDRAVMPAFNVIRSLQDGGKHMKLGRKIIQGIRISPHCTEFDVRYSPRLSFEEFVVAPQHRDSRTVVVSGTVLRTRPRFDTWELVGILLRDPDMLSPDDLNAAIQKAGLYEGIGDFRVGTPRGGRYGTYTGHTRDLGAEEVEKWS